MKYIRFLFLTTLYILALPFSEGFAQKYNPEKMNKKARALNERAYEEAIDGRYSNALNFLEQALKIEPGFVDVYLTRAGIHANMRNYTASIQDFKKAFELDAVYAEEFRLPYSISLAGNGQFEEAHQQINLFLQIPSLNEQSIKAGNYRKGTYEFALGWKKKYGSEILPGKPLHLSESVNSKDSEYFPSLTIDGKTMVFTRRLNQYDEDFFYSEYKNGAWQTAKPLEGKVNTNLNEGAQNIAQDGTLLVFTGCNYPEGAGSCDLYISYLRKDGSWSEAENLNINTEGWESTPSLAPDKSALYFSSNNPGGFGGKDIWVTRKLPGGKWSKPENLGPTINTPGDESCPFMHADNETLYFNSTGHPGYGSTDLFLSRKTADGWEGPINLGYPLNTIDDEGSLVVASDGVTAYFSSDRGETIGGLDLFSFQLPVAVQATPTRWVRGKVYDAKTNEGLPSAVELTNLSNGELAFKLQTDEDGNYLATLPQGKEYAFNVSRKGYLFFSEHYALNQHTPDSGLTVNIALQPLETGASVILNNIFYDVNATTLKEASMQELNKLVQLMTENPTLQIRIEGHTDNTGAPADNLRLSTQRAQTVVDYLITKGIEKNRLHAKGFGETKPVDSNNTEAGKSRNRRTELHIHRYTP
jgi:outer membrane protein OmpA-like peptidoglycan-associated protein/tetratricopeptide (TPR) repeat protein